MNNEKHQNIEKRKGHAKVLFFVICMSLMAWTVFGSNMLWWSEKWIIYTLVFSFVIFYISQIKKPIILLILLLTSILWYSLSQNEVQNRNENLSHVQLLTQSYTWVIQISGIVEKELYRDDTSISYRLLIDNIDKISTTKKIHFLIQFPKNSQPKIGDIVEIKSKIIDPKIQNTWFWKYLFFQNISWKIYANTFTITKKSPEWYINSIKKPLETHIFKGFPRDYAGLILWMTIWNTNLIRNDIKQSFQNAGLTHILVVSGSNIAFVIIFLSGIIKYIPIGRFWRMSIISIFIGLYGTLVWWEIPVIRATLMGIIWYIWLEYTSKISSIAILFLIGIILIIIEPLSLVYDVGFWLSFVATMTIILYGKDITALLWTIWCPRIISETLAITTAASLWTIPITLYFFGKISLGFFIANILIWGCIWWILFFSVWYMLLWFLWNTFLYWYGYMVYVPIKYIIYIANTIWWWWVISIPESISLFILIISSAFFIEKILSNSIYYEENQKNVLSSKSGV